MIEKMKCKNNEKAQPIMNVHAHKSKPENLEAKKNADNISIAINETDEIISSVFLSDYFLNEYLPKFASEQWDKMKVQDRRVLMATVNTLVSETLGNETILKHGIIKMNMPYRDENLLFKDGECCIYDKLFTYKGIGISLLINYIRELRKYICYTLAEISFYDDVDYYSLRGKAKIYYENLSESILYNSWSNYLQKDNPDYRFQPLVLDSEIFSMKLLKEFLKDRFNKTQNIDKENSTLSNEYLVYVPQLTR